jgi:hypothetical protein
MAASLGSAMAQAVGCGEGGLFGRFLADYQAQHLLLQA